MKISQSKNIKKPIVIASLILITLIAAGITAASYYKVGFFASKLDNSINLSTPSDNEKQAASDIKKQSLNQAGSKTQTGSDPAPAPQPIEGSDKKSVGIEITAANQDTSTLHVRTLIQAVVSSGKCTITITNSSHAPYTASVDTQALPSSTTCKGFDIPLNNLTQGTWMITVAFSNDSLTASTSKEISIQ